LIGNPSPQHSSRSIDTSGKTDPFRTQDLAGESNQAKATLIPSTARASDEIAVGMPLFLIYILFISFFIYILFLSYLFLT